VLIRRDGTRRRLLRFPTRHEAALVEQAVEGLLGIPDRRVAGEAPRRLPDAEP
jgi:hypothetical protein